MEISVLRQVLTIRRKALTIWALSICGVSGMYTGIYPMMEDMDLEAMLESMPPAMVEALGYDDMVSAAGYVGAAVYGLVALALLLVFGIGNGAKVLAGHEEDGELELELTSPLSRSSVFAQRFLALAAQVVVLVGILFVVTLAISEILQLGIAISLLAAASLQLALLVLFFGTVSFAVGAATGRRGLGLGAGAGLAVVSWMFNAIGPTADQDWMAAVSPIGWYMDENPVTRGFQGDDAAFLALGIAIALAVGWWRFRKRDLMS